MEPPKRLITQILETAFLFALAVFLIRTAVHWLLEIWPVLVILASIVFGSLIGYRIYKFWRDGGIGKW